MNLFRNMFLNIELVFLLQRLKINFSFIVIFDRNILSVSFWYNATCKKNVKQIIDWIQVNLRRMLFWSKMEGSYITAKVKNIVVFLVLLSFVPMKKWSKNVKAKWQVFWSAVNEVIQIWFFYDALYYLQYREKPRFALLSEVQKSAVVRIWEPVF